MRQVRMQVQAGRAERVGVSDRGPTDYGKGRVCTYEGCGKLVCRYRPGDRCWQHEVKTYGHRVAS